MRPSSHPTKRKSPIFTSTATPSGTARKRQRLLANEAVSSSDRSTKRQQTLTQMQFAPPSIDVDQDRDPIGFIQEKSRSAGKKRLSAERKPKQKLALEQKNTLTQMGHFANFPPELDDNEDDLHLDLIHEQQETNRVPGSRPKKMAAENLTPCGTTFTSANSRRLKSVTKAATDIKKKKAKRKPDPWELSSSQPEAGTGLIPTGLPQRTTSPNSTRPAKAAVARKIRSLDRMTETTAIQEGSEESRDVVEDALAKPLPTTPSKAPRKRKYSPHEVIPSSTSPESLPPSTRRSQHTARRKSFADTKTSPLGERSINVPSKVPMKSHLAREKFTKRLRRIDNKQRKELDAIPREGPARILPRSLIVKLKVPRPPEECSKAQNTMISQNPCRRNHTGIKKTEDKLPFNDLPSKMGRQPSKLLVDGWPELEQMVGRPKARAETVRTSNIFTNVKYARTFDGANEVEAEYSVGAETQLALEQLESSTGSTTVSAIETNNEENQGLEKSNVVDSGANDDAFSLGSPVHEECLMKLGQTRSQQQADEAQQSMPQHPTLPPTSDPPTKTPARCPPTSSPIELPSRSSYYNSSPPNPQSTQLPSLDHQSQIITQENTQQHPLLSTFPASSRHRSSPPRHVVTIKDSDPTSIPLYEIPPHYLRDSDEDETYFDGDLDPTPRRPLQTQRASAMEADGPGIGIELDFPSLSPSPSPSLSLLPQPRLMPPHPPLLVSVKQENENENPDGDDDDEGDGDENEYEHELEVFGKGKEKEAVMSASFPSSSPILKNGVRYLRESLMESLPGPPPLPLDLESENESWNGSGWIEEGEEEEAGEREEEGKEIA